MGILVEQNILKILKGIGALAEHLSNCALSGKPPAGFIEPQLGSKQVNQIVRIPAV